MYNQWQGLTGRGNTMVGVLEQGEPRHQLPTKRLELLRELLPEIDTVAILANPRSRGPSRIDITMWRRNCFRSPPKTTGSTRCRNETY